MKQREAERNGTSYVAKHASAAPELDPENHLAWELFLRAQSQAICGPLGGVIGLRHEPVEMYMRLLRVPEEDRLEAFDKFRIIETLYVASQNERGAKTRGQEASDPARGQVGRHRRDR